MIATSKQLAKVLSSVNIHIESNRSVEQEKAFNHVNGLINSLSEILKQRREREKNNVKAKALDEEYENAKMKIQVYLNTCTSSNDPRVAIDEKFQKYMIECTIDDQKKFRKQLEQLHKYTIH